MKWGEREREVLLLKKVSLGYRDRGALNLAQPKVKADYVVNKKRMEKCVNRNKMRH